ncbi:MAG: rod-binding protein [Rhizomicrobium sp.]|nr:rod-binding protein [Rhizomicrobium sp.]
MTMDMTATTMNVAQAPIHAPAATSNVARAQKAGKEFEGVFLTQMLGQMFSGLTTDGPFGGGQGESMFRSLMLDEYGKQISAQGGIGLAKNVTAELIKHQEAAQQAQDASAAKTAPSVSDKSVPSAGSAP